MHLGRSNGENGAVFFLYGPDETDKLEEIMQKGFEK
jgi:hypothetical protein